MHRQISFERSGMPAARPQRPEGATDAAKRHLLLRLGRHILAAAQRFLTAQRTHLRIRRDEELLRQMSDYELRDIGLARLPGGHFAPLGGDLRREQPVQNLRTLKPGRPDIGHARKRGAARR